MKSLTALAFMLVPAVAFAAGGGSTPKHPPAEVEKIAGSKLSSVTLTEKAAQRVGIKTVLVREDTVTESGWSAVWSCRPHRPHRPRS